MVNGWVLMLIVGGMALWTLWMVGMYLRGVWRDERTKPKHLCDPHD